MSKQFDILQKIPLNTVDSGYLDMVKIGSKFYFTSSRSGVLDNGEPGPGNHLLMLDLQTKEYQKINVTEGYPTYMTYDEKGHRLLVSHDALYIPNYKFSILDLNNLSITTLDFEEINDEKRKYELDPLVTIQEGEYYFLFNDTLVRYNPLDRSKQTFDLQTYGIDKAHAMIFK